SGVQIPLHDQSAVAINVHVAWRVVAFPRDEDVPASTLFTHRCKMLPYKETQSTSAGTSSATSRAARDSRVPAPDIWRRGGGIGELHPDLPLARRFLHASR